MLAERTAHGAPEKPVNEIQQALFMPTGYAASSYFAIRKYAFSSWDGVACGIQSASIACC
jgi:hypothetical protein